MSTLVAVAAIVAALTGLLNFGVFCKLSYHYGQTVKGQEDLEKRVSQFELRCEARHS